MRPKTDANRHAAYGWMLTARARPIEISTRLLGRSRGRPAGCMPPDEGQERSQPKVGWESRSEP